MIPQARYVGDTELVWPEGFHASLGYRPGEVHMTAKAAGWTLTGIASEFVFYHPAALLTCKLKVDPVALYWAENELPAYDAPYWFDLLTPTFHGLPPPLDRILFACPREHAKGLLTFLDRITMSQSTTDPTQQLVDSVNQVLPIIDHRLLKKLTIAPLAPPIVKAAVYGYETKDWARGWAPYCTPRDGSWQLMTAKRSPPPPLYPKRPRKGNS